MTLFNQSPLAIPPRTRSRVDPAYLAQIMALPETARLQAKQALFDQIGQLPQTLFNTASAVQQYRQQQALNPLAVQEAQAKLEDIRAQAAERTARASRLSKIVETANKEPNVFAEAMKNLRSNLAFMTTTDQDVRHSMIDNEIDLVKNANQRLRGGQNLNPASQPGRSGVTTSGVKFTIRPK